MGYLGTFIPPKLPKPGHYCSKPGAAGIDGTTWDCPDCGTIYELRYSAKHGFKQVWVKAGLFKRIRHILLWEKYQ